MNRRVTIVLIDNDHMSPFDLEELVEGAVREVLPDTMTIMYTYVES